jgi:hypothetical protein
LVKSHLTSAVREEIAALKNQIRQLTEMRTRLEQENLFLKQNATPETLKLLESRNFNLNQQQQQQLLGNYPNSNMNNNNLILNNENLNNEMNIIDSNGSRATSIPPQIQTNMIDVVPINGVNTNNDH